MTLRHLFPCAGCARHVRASEPACPFCAAPMGRAPAEPALPTQRLSRAALFAFGAAVAAAGACVPEGAAPVHVAEPGAYDPVVLPPTPPAPMTPDASHAPDPYANMAPAYGAVPSPEPHVGPTATRYGAPPPHHGPVPPPRPHVGSHAPRYGSPPAFEAL